MLFFGNKIERQLKRYARENPELEIKYTHSKRPYPSKLLQVNRDGILLVGFSGALESRNLDVRILTTQESFVTKILRCGQDKKGVNLYYCSLPKSIEASWLQGEERYVIYPNGLVRLLINTNQGERSASGPIWDFSQYGLSFVNKSSIQFPVGTKISHAFIKIQDMETQLVDLQVTSVRKEQFQGQELDILCCLFKSKAKGMEKMLLRCRKLESA